MRAIAHVFCKMHAMLTYTHAWWPHLGAPWGHQQMRREILLSALSALTHIYDVVAACVEHCHVELVIPQALFVLPRRLPVKESFYLE